MATYDNPFDDKKEVEICLKVGKGKMPELVKFPADAMSHPADLAILPGTRMPDFDQVTEEKGWIIAERITDLCLAGWKAQKKAEPEENKEHEAYLSLDRVEVLIKDFIETLVSRDVALCDETEEEILRAMLRHVRDAKNKIMCKEDD